MSGVWRSPSQQPMPIKRAALLVLTGGGMVLGGIEFPSVHSLWLAPLGALLVIYGIGRVVSR